MKRCLDLKRAGRLCLAAILIVTGSTAVFAQTTLRIFLGGQQHHDVMRQIVETYSQVNQGVKIEVEPGGVTPEQQQQYLSTVLSTKDPSLDLVLIDVIRPAQWAAAQWAEPLDPYLGAEKETVLTKLLPAYRTASVVDGRMIALPYAGDAQFLYYRKDLIEKYGLEPPRTWAELQAAAVRIMEGEKRPGLRGFEAAGAPIEGTVCSYLVPLWGAGEDLVNEGKLNLASDAARKPFQLWADLKAAKVTPPNLAEIPTDRIRQDLQAGNLIFGITWSYVWSRLQNDADSAVRGRIGITTPPGFSADKPASCIGGWQIAVTAFSKNKAEAVKFARHLASPEVAKVRAALGAHMPVYAGLYEDREVLAANPWFAEAQPAMQVAKARPVTARYSEVSEVIRANMSAFLAGTKTADGALADMNSRLAAILK